MKKMMTLAFVLWIGILSACSPPATDNPPTVKTPTTSTPTKWYNKTVFYEIFVRSFYDSDGNGIGDFNGITSHLDYLTNLGVGAIWLMPIQKSPSYHGYDASDYYSVNSDYGTLADFTNLLQQAHQRNIKVILDLVINHCSDQNPWFTNSASSKNSPYRDWFVWSDTNTLPGSWHAKNGSYYYAYFNSTQPDLNYRNPDVQNEMERIVRFWLDKGIDGYRVDAPIYLYEDFDTGELENLPETHAYLATLHKLTDTEYQDKYWVGEVWQSSSVIKSYLDDGDFDQCFDFPFFLNLKTAVDNELPALFQGHLDTVETYPSGSLNNATFLRNHDMDRLASKEPSEAKRKLFYRVMLTLPGTPYIYYGEEIGMTGKKGSGPYYDEYERTPMQWDATVNAGFTTATNTWFAVNADYTNINVSEELSNTNSLLQTVRHFIHLRNSYPALQYGKDEKVGNSNNYTWAYLRTTSDQKILVVHNFSSSSQTGITLKFSGTSLNSSNDYTLKDLDTESSLSTHLDSAHFTNYTLPALQPYESKCYLIQ